VVPEYYWFDGDIRDTLPGEPVDDSGVVPINHGGAQGRGPRFSSFMPVMADWRMLPGFYMPGRDRNDTLDLFGWLLVVATLGGIIASKGRKSRWPR